jgi:methionyl-tRNA synthetase
MLTFAFKNFDGAVPQPGALSAEDLEIIATVDGAFEPVADDIDACHFRSALTRAMAAAREVNRYLDAAAPWKVLKSDPQRAATATYVALRTIDSLKLLFAPFLPFSSQQLHESLGYTNSIFGTQSVQEYQENSHKHSGLTYAKDWAGDCWKPSTLPPGQALQRPQPLFRKLDEEIVAQEIARLGSGW